MVNRRQFLRNTSLAAAGSLLASCLPAQPEAKTEAPPGIILPPRLKKGDLIALHAPAGAIFNEESIQKATTALEGAGFRIKICDTLKQKFGYLAGSDEFRAKELNDLFSDKTVNGIVAMRGGWGCARLLPLLDFENIKKNPKVISGFSDITTLLLAIHAKTGMITFHGPVGNSSWGDFTMNHFLRMVAEGEIMELKQPVGNDSSVLTAGKASGKLLGGNLTVLCSLIGSDYLPDFTDSILFLEETEEEPYSIDRLLTQLSLNGVLKKSKGFVFGKCSKCEAEEPDKSFTTEEVLKQKLVFADKPFINGFAFGHTTDKFTIPVGANATLDTSTNSVKMEYACVI
jgi:muramoyltetrapeptide carboxypeptidase